MAHDNYLHIRIDTDLLTRLDAWRKAQNPKFPPSRSDAVRFAIEEMIREADMYSTAQDALRPRER